MHGNKLIDLSNIIDIMKYKETLKVGERLSEDYSRQLGEMADRVIRPDPKDIESRFNQLQGVKPSHNSRKLWATH